ncbi:IPT/TIG domain-containing protein [Streptomyces radicis]|uniref:Cell surface protein n=1 Tax=Streptomyces radicis TaxID=1750517 RepID=A0A3A9VY04_9ACTN|nr:IPT/TIG domain-containing protein [Streptomyces radicis]RKN05402.1 cell surface protein [Streptomyces radicis]RKN16910.1 cell surface protein [Streptomyces radicis]
MAPVITSISPTQGTSGTAVTITGTGFGALASTPTVRFGNTSVTGTVTVANTQITATAPGGCAGQVNVTVTVGASTSNGRPFFYIAAPTVSGVSANVGPDTAPPASTLFGSGFASATAVTFGVAGAGTLGPVSGDSQRSVTPPTFAVTGAPVTVSVTATNPGGTSAITGASDQYTYYDQPTAATISPNTGAPGDTGVLITGTGFYDVSAVTFTDPAGPTDFAAGFAALSDTQLIVTVPSGAPAGTALDVTVTNPGGTTTPALVFTT